MKKNQVLTLFLSLMLVCVFSTNLLSQNLVSNPSFETYNSCPDGQSWIARDSVPPWKSFINSADLYVNDPATSCFHFGPGSASAGGQFDEPHSGVAFAGIKLGSNSDNTVAEAVQIKLTNKLVSGQTYNVEFFVHADASTGGEIDKIGAYFSVDAPTDINNVNPQVENPAGNFISSSEGWVEISGSYTAIGGEEWLSITRSPDATLTNNSYYFIDDVSVIWTGVLQPNDCCPSSQLYENTSDLPFVTKRLNFIKAGNDVGLPGSGPVIVERGDYVVFNAPDIILDLGFTAEFGSEFIAEPIACNPLDGVQKINECFAGTDISFCGESPSPFPAQLGMSAQPGVTYAWTADPLEAIMFLNDRTIPNPTFTPPAVSSFSAARYTLHASIGAGECGDEKFCSVDIRFKSTSGLPTLLSSNIGNMLGFPSSTNQFCFKVANANRFEVELRDGWGTKVYEFSGFTTFINGEIFACLFSDGSQNIVTDVFGASFVGNLKLYNCDNDLFETPIVLNITIPQTNSSNASNISQGQAVENYSYFEEDNQPIIDSTKLQLNETEEIKFRAIPNPNSGSFFIISDNNLPITRIEAYSSLGELMFVKTNLNQTSVSINEEFVPGMYFIKVWNNDNSSYVKVLIN